MVGELSVLLIPITFSFLCHPTPQTALMVIHSLYIGLQDPNPYQTLLCIEQHYCPYTGLSPLHGGKSSSPM
ncbi:hypothetical protein GDO81_005667 [Engystomops pustulosus]|uniref:Secreted protein n=1 Tax=Engystomops pustulosus TaxID=76066 RepID=A0AAV7CQU0_ENGPU|nr:hypothetical protein GDO81_005667 [Engystomops pustulosus]